MDDRRVADYFVVAGLPEIPEPLDDATLSEGGNLKNGRGQPPITDLAVAFPYIWEKQSQMVMRLLQKLLRVLLGRSQSR
ncbi:hypothetical protein NQ317_008263 [Molorchus minor]|uniref:Uncharacterized protein n=1 Tax=Molorchus minor TaxID=1323400 RepID=A0ABQ9J7X4_9CUCU|nr:hypothetical protein NQ317_008263 [Molorchus minor]